MEIDVVFVFGKHNNHTYNCFYSVRRNVKDYSQMTYLLSGEKYGFPMRKRMPICLKRNVKLKIGQDWKYVVTLRKEEEYLPHRHLKNVFICNYGGKYLNANLAEDVIEECELCN